MAKYFAFQNDSVFVILLSLDFFLFPTTWGQNYFSLTDTPQDNFSHAFLSNLMVLIASEHTPNTEVQTASLLSHKHSVLISGPLSSFIMCSLPRPLPSVPKVHLSCFNNETTWKGLDSRDHFHISPWKLPGPWLLAWLPITWRIFKNYELLIFTSQEYRSGRAVRDQESVILSNILITQVYLL